MSEIEKSEIQGPDGLTPKQSVFVYKIAVEGLNITRAAEAAGYSHPSATGSALARLPHIRAAITAKRQTVIETDLAAVGLRVMRRLMEDELTPAPVRFQAAKWSLEASGHAREQSKAGLPSADKPLSEMSISELEDFIQRGEKALDGIKKVSAPVVELQAVAVEGSAQDSAQLLPPA